MANKQWPSQRRSQYIMVDTTTSIAALWFYTICIYIYIYKICQMHIDRVKKKTCQLIHIYLILYRFNYFSVKCIKSYRYPYPEPVVFQWQSSGNPVCLELRPQCTLECHWRNASVLPVVFQWSSSGFPVVFQCVPIMQINTGSPLGHHWVLASASVVPVASQCTCGSSDLPVCSNYVN